MLYTVNNVSSPLRYIPLTGYVIINPVLIKPISYSITVITCVAINPITKKLLLLTNDKDITIQNAYDYVINKKVVFKEDLSKLKYVEQLNLFNDVERSNEWN